MLTPVNCWSAAILQSPAPGEGNKFSLVGPLENVSGSQSTRLLAMQPITRSPVIVCRFWNFQESATIYPDQKPSVAGRRCSTVVCFSLRTFRDVRFPVAIRCKADLEQTAFTCEFASPSPAVAFPRALAFAHLRLTQEFSNIPRESARQPTEPSRTRC